MTLQCNVSPSPTELYTPPVCDFCGARQGKFRVLLRAETGAATCNQCADIGDTHIEVCPVCVAPLKPDDICANDIELGICHAECLKDSPVVDLDTGEETGGEITTFRYGEVK